MFACGRAPTPAPLPLGLALPTAPAPDLGSADDDNEKAADAVAALKAQINNLKVSLSAAQRIRQRKRLEHHQHVFADEVGDDDTVHAPEKGG